MSHARYRVSLTAALAIALAGLVSSMCAQEPAKLPVPAEAAQQAALVTVKQVFADDYAAATKPDFKSALAQKLIGQAQATADDPTARYVMLCEARDLATDVADCELLDQTIAALAASYTIDPTAMQYEAFQKMVHKSRPAAANKAIAEKLAKLVDESLAAGRFEAAGQFAKLTVTAAGKAHDQPLIKLARERSDEIEVIRADHAAAEKVREVLAKNEDDPDANLVLGKYQCFVEGGWATGLPHLAKGGDAALKALATKSLAAADAAALARIGDDWFAAAESAKAKEKSQLQRAAMYWYAKALPGLSGLEKVRVTQRLKPVAAEKHPRGAVAAGGHFYKVFNEKMSWEEAKAKCEELGGYLVCISSPREDATIVQIVEAQIGPGMMGREAYKYLIGAYLEDGKWKWLSGEAFNYAPNKLPAEAKRPYLRHAGRNWLDTSPDGGLIAGFICEWDK